MAPGTFHSTAWLSAQQSSGLKFICPFIHPTRPTRTWYHHVRGSVLGSSRGEKCGQENAKQASGTALPTNNEGSSVSSVATVENGLTASLKVKHELPYDPALPLLVRYPRELKTGSQTDTCTQMFTAA